MATDVFLIQACTEECDTWCPVGWELSKEGAMKEIERFKKDFPCLRIKHRVEAVNAEDRVGSRGVIFEWQRGDYEEKNTSQ